LLVKLLAVMGIGRKFSRGGGGRTEKRPKNNKKDRK